MLLLSILNAVQLAALAMTPSAASIDTVARSGLFRILLGVILALVSFYAARRRSGLPLRTLVVVFLVSAVWLLSKFGLVTVAGVARWLPILPGLSVDLLAIVSTLAVLTAAELLSERHADLGTGEERRRIVQPLGWLMVAIAVTALLVPSIGMAFLTVGTIAVGANLAGLRSRRLIVQTAAFLLLGLTAVLFEPYRRERLFTLLDPWTAPYDYGYSQVQMAVSIASGGWFGLGLGESIGAQGFVPYPLTSARFATLVEEMGLVGGVIVIALLGLVVVLPLTRPWRVHDRAAAYGAVFSAWVAGSTVLHIGACLGLVPLNFIDLPFFTSSIGLPSWVLLGTALGVVSSSVAPQDGPEQSKGHLGPKVDLR